MKNLLSLTIDQSMRVKNREGDHREFKATFENKSLPKYAKTIVAFANRDGGALFFGIKDRPREIVGIPIKNIPDELVFANFLKEYFEPEIVCSLDTKIYDGKTIFALEILPSEQKPVICKKEKKIKTEDANEVVILRAGAIYYRYSSSSEEIKYAELRSLLDNQVNKIFRSMIENITLIQKVGYDQAAIVGANELVGNDKLASIYISTETAKKMNCANSKVKCNKLLEC